MATSRGHKGAEDGAKAAAAVVPLSDSSKWSESGLARRRLRLDTEIDDIVSRELGRSSTAPLPQSLDADLSSS
jgi:hypothetical protein